MMSVPKTVSPPEAVEIDITGKTYHVGNDEFLLAVFGGLTDARPVVLSLEGNPANSPARVWTGRAWTGTPEVSASLPSGANNYFSLAIFRPDEAGQFRRQKEHIHALCAVMLDDIGRKVALERLTLPPSWLLETSTGNHQAGYLPSDPLADGSVTDRLINAIVAARLRDLGALAQTKPKAKVLGAVTAVPAALNAEDFDGARDWATAALRVLERRWPETSMENLARSFEQVRKALVRDEQRKTLARCVELLLRVIAGGDA